MKNEEYKIRLQGKEVGVKGEIPQRWIKKAAEKVGLEDLPPTRAFYVTDISAPAIYEPEEGGAPWHLIVIPEEDRTSRGDVKSFLRHELAHVKLRHTIGYKDAKDFAFKELATSPIEEGTGKYTSLNLAATATSIIKEYGLSREEAWRLTRSAARKLGVSKNIITRGHNLFLRYTESISLG